VWTLACQVKHEPPIGVPLLGVRVGVRAEPPVPLMTSPGDNDVKNFGEGHSVTVNVGFVPPYTVSPTRPTQEMLPQLQTTAELLPENDGGHT
jgi:hypothetical protein